MKNRIFQLLAMGICLFGLPVLAAPLEVGGEIPKISAKDQRGMAYAFTNGTTFLFIALEMECAKAANQKFTQQGAGYLEKHGAAYLMDIHSMPAIARVFALPKMRKYPHRIILSENAEALNWVPVKAGHVTVLALTPAGRIQKVTYWKPASEPVADMFK